MLRRSVVVFTRFMLGSIGLVKRYGEVLLIPTINKVPHPDVRQTVAA